MEQKPIGLNITDFAELVGVNERTIRLGLKSGRVLIGADGFIDPETQVARWHMTRDLSKVRGRPSTASTPQASLEAAQQFEQIKVKKASVDLKLSEEQLARAQGSSISREDVRRALASFARLQSTKWTNFASRYGLEIAAQVGCDSKALMAALDKFVRVQLEEISTNKPILPNE